MSKNFLPMMITVFTAVVVYYLLSARIHLSENLSMAGGVAAAIISAVAARKLFRRE